MNSYISKKFSEKNVEIGISIAKKAVLSMVSEQLTHLFFGQDVQRTTTEADCEPAFWRCDSGDLKMSYRSAK